MKSISKNYLLIVYYCIRHASIVLAIESAAAGSIAFWVGMKISSAYGLTQTALGGLWCAISVFMVICAEEKRTLVLGLNRVVAVFIGVVISGAIISGLGAGIASLLISLLICVIIVSLLRKKTCYRSVSITVAIIYLFRYMVPQLNIWWICLGVCRT